MSTQEVRFSGGLFLDSATTTPDDQSAVPADAVLTGRVESAAGTGLSGLTLTVGPDQSGADDEITARAETDGHGDFRMRLSGLGALTTVTLHVRVSTGPDADSIVLDESVDVSLQDGRGRLLLAVTLDEPQLYDADWVEVADAAQLAGLDRLDLLTGELSRSSSTTFAMFPLATRQALANQLEQALLDPTEVLRNAAGPVPTLRALQDPEQLARFVEAAAGQQTAELLAAAATLTGIAQSFSALAEVDWPVSLDDLRRADLGTAVHRFSDRFVVGVEADPDFPAFHTSDRIRYRDYLRAIWTVAGSNVVVDGPKQMSDTQARQQLEHRFHQNFRTLNDSRRPANELAAGILTQILVAPTGSGFGFAVAQATITPRGDRSARDYLDFLIGLSRESAIELTLRYHLDLTRSDSEASSLVDENITALQGFLRDTFQANAEPDHVPPDTLGQPIVPSKLQGHAPFFLYYDEWLEQQRVFHGENYLDVRRLVTTVLDKNQREALEKRAFGGAAKPLAPGQPDFTENWKLVAAVLAVTDAMATGHSHFQNGEFPLAERDYESARKLAIEALGSKALSSLDFSKAAKTRRDYPIGGMKALREFEQLLRNDNGNLTGYLVSEVTWPTDMALRLVVLSLYVLPICRGDVALASGEFDKAVFRYGQASRFAVGMARLSDTGGYKSIGGFSNFFEQYTHGELPYTVILDPPGTRTVDSSSYPNESESDLVGAASAIENLASKTGTGLANPVEIKLFRLRQGNAMLDWADSLYRTDQPGNVQRARELYKGVLFLWGELPPIAPHWPPAFFLLPTLFTQNDENPAIMSQKQRARLGLHQIDAGLNYFGETPDLVPVLRFRPLKEQADRMAAAAKGAQIDFIQATNKVENALVEQMRLTTLVEKSSLQTAIGAEQIAITQADVQVAKEQVAAVEAAIAAKKAEIADSDSLFSQFSDFARGMKKTFESLPEGTKSSIGAGVTAEATGDAMVGEGMLGLGAGASVMTGIGVFAVAGYITMSGMADAANARIGDLSTLQGKALPAAQRAVASRLHAQRIAELQKRIAEADLDLAKRLIAFEQDKLLNIQFWVNIAQLARRLMRRYLDMGGRLAWLAERALAYEQDRPLRLVRLDYHLERLQGVTGADLLQVDLAELELARVEGLKRTVPVKRTMSLARDFPLAYGQLKATGRCTFRTLEGDFRRAYPGTNSFRVRAVSVSLTQADFSAPLRGSLINQGVSVSHPGQSGTHVLVRPTESLPLSEFRLRDDLALYGLPGETLLPFEGSAVESFWEVELPAAGNSASLDSLQDVLITFDLRAQFDPHQRVIDLGAPPAPVRRWVLLSAATLAPDAIADLRGVAAVPVIEWPMDRLPLAAQEKNRTVKNVAVFTVDITQHSFEATLDAADAGTSVPISLVDGYAASTEQPDPAAPPLPPTPLDAVAGAALGQPFRLTVDKAANPGVDFSRLRDVVLALEYQADLV